MNLTVITGQLKTLGEMVGETKVMLTLLTPPETEFVESTWMFLIPPPNE